MEGRELPRSILSTLAYYHALGVTALTSAEVFRYLVSEPPLTARQKNTFRDTVCALADLKRQGLVELASGHYHLQKAGGADEGQAPLRQGYAGQAPLRPASTQATADNQGYAGQGTRPARLKDSISKRKALLRTIKYLAYMPYVRMLAISGSAAVGNADKESDLDIVIGSDGNRVWTTRMLVTAFVHLLGKRRHGQKIKDRICLNHYFETGKPFFPQDQMPVAAIYAQVIPVFGAGEFEESYQQSPWVSSLLQNTFPTRISAINITPPKALLALRNIGEFILNRVAGNYVEKVMASAQKRRIRRALGNITPDSLELYINDGTLMFHYPFSRSKEALKGYQEYLQSLQTVDKV